MSEIKQQYRNKRLGFTLIELSMAISIIAILSAMAVAGFKAINKSAREKIIVNNLRQVAYAANNHFTETGAVEVILDDLVGDGKAIRQIKSVDGEIYPELIRLNDPLLIAQGSSVGEVSVPFN